MPFESDIPAHVLRFIDEKIDTVPQLEALLIMCQEENRTWQVSEVAARIYITEEAAHVILDTLRRRSLVSSDESHRFRFNPGSPEIRALVTEVGLIYQTNLSRIATFIHSKPSASVKEFARAFDFKKDP